MKYQRLTLFFVFIVFCIFCFVKFINIGLAYTEEQCISFVNQGDDKDQDPNTPSLT